MSKEEHQVIRYKKVIRFISDRMNIEICNFAYFKKFCNLKI